MRRYDVKATYTTGWVEIEIDDEFLEDCDNEGIDIDNDEDVVREYMNQHCGEFDSYLDLDDVYVERTDDDDFSNGKEDN